jgi:hypothetical protein
MIGTHGRATLRLGQPVKKKVLKVLREFADKRRDLLRRD